MKYFLTNTSHAISGSLGEPGVCAAGRLPGYAMSAERAIEGPGSPSRTQGLWLAAHRIETFGSSTNLRWTCRGRYDGRCGASPKIEWRRLVKRVRRLARQGPERPIIEVPP